MNLSQIFVACWLSLAIGLTGLAALLLVRHAAKVPFRDRGEVYFS